MIRLSGVFFRFSMLVAALLVAGGVSGAAVAQTGPGGVGESDGTSDLKVWLRADQLSLSDGTNVSSWSDASGYGNDVSQSTSANQPTFRESGGPSSGPAVAFDPSSSEEFLDGTFSKSDGVTLISLYSHQSGTVARGTILEVHDGNQNVRNIIQARPDDNNLVYYDGANNLTGGSYSGGTSIIHTATHVGTEVDMFKNGASIFTSDSENGNGSTSDFRVGNDVTGGNGIDGVATEIIAFSKALNAAERTIVENYLSSKYGVSLAAGDKFAYDTNYGSDVSGIGRETSSAQHLSSNSDVLNFEVGGSVDATGFSADDQYVLVGHDDGAQEDFSTSSFSEPINGLSADAKRIGRTWRTDLTFNNGSGPKSVTISVDTDSLPAKPNAGDSYFILVDNGSSSFDGSPEAYELTGSGTLSTTIELADGDYIAVGAGQRTVNVVPTSTSQREDLAAADSPKSLTVKLNLPYTSSGQSEVDGNGTDVTVNFSDTGDLDGSGNIEDGGITNASGSNSNGDYEADDGSGSDTAGDFNGDYRVNTSSPVTITAGNGTVPINYDVDDDGITVSGEGEQTERFEISLDGTVNGNASIGASRFEFAISDDDDPRKADFNTPTQTITEGDGGGSRIVTFQIDLAADAATSAPLTSVDVTAVEAQTDATFGDVSSDVTADVEIVDESGGSLDSDGQQIKMSSTEAEVTFDDASNTTTAQFKLRVNEDALDESDSEKAVFDLKTPTSAALAGSDTRLTVTINDDDSAPTVQFATSSKGNDESVDGSVDVTLSGASGKDVTVDFAVDSGQSEAQGGGEDFSIGTSSPLTFPAGTTSPQTISITVNDDSKNELEESIVLDLSSPSNATLGSTTTHTYNIQDNDASLIGSTGPAGVGDTDGTGELTLWLRADAVTGVSDGGNLSTWPDTSGNDNDASVSSGNAPKYTESGLNGRPEVQFDAANNEWMEGTASKSGPVTMYAVYRHQSGAIDFGTVLELDGSTRNILQARPTDDDVAYYDGVSTLQSGSYSSGENIIHGVTHAGTDVSIYKNGGAAVFSTSSGNDNTSTSSFFLGNDSSDGNEIDGAVSEAFAFAASLGEARRKLIENYFSAKYDIALTGGDVYAGDQSGNGDYDLGVFGIGRESTDAFHTQAETDGLRFELANGLDENGDYLLAGHRTAANSATTTDINGLSGDLDVRSVRTWYTDVTNSGTGITVDVTVDLSETGLSGPAGDAGNYVLLQRTADAADGTSWAPVQEGASGIANGDEISFNNVSLTDGKEITLGTTDAASSPLVTKDLVITGNSSAADGKDQGWRYMGLPVTGGTAGDLHRADGSDFIDFRVDMVYTNPGGDVQGNASGWEAVEQPSEGLPAGRGFILWLYDDENYPLDPSITLTVPPSLTGPGQSNVTVGDGAPAGDDPALAQSNKQFLLSNPYAVPFGLDNLNGSGFDSVVQVWEADATKNSNDISGDDDENVGSFVTRSRSGNDRVAAWQGFLLTRSSTGSGDTQVTFNSNGRAPSATPDFVGSKTQEIEPTQHRVPLRLVGRDAAGDLAAIDRAASVLFHERAEHGRDRYDAPKFEPMAGTFATLAPVASAADDALRAQESRPLPEGDTVTVPLSVQTQGLSGTFEIEMPTGGAISTETPSIPENWEVALVDTKGTEDPSDDATQILTPGGTPYTFSVETAKAGPTAKAAATAPDSSDGGAPTPELRRLTLPRPDSTGAKTAKASETVSTRFALKIRPEESVEEAPDRPPTPTLEIATMDARRKGERAVVTWTTTPVASSADDFQVQYQRLSADDETESPRTSDWETLGQGKKSKKSKSKEGDSYRFESKRLDYGRHVFRLRHGDTKTDPVEVNMKLEGAYDVEVPYPNPSTQTATLPVTVQNRQQVTVTVYDLMGRRVRVAHRDKVQEQKTKRIKLTVRGLSSGTYFVRVRGDEFATTRRLIVVH
jgi:hypothetical protein